MSVQNITTENFVKLYNKDSSKLELIDVREADEYLEQHIKDSKLMPLSTVKERMSEINWNKQVIFICRSGARSGYIAKILSDEQGKDTYNLEKGIIDVINKGNNDIIKE